MSWISSSSSYNILIFWGLAFAVGDKTPRSGVNYFLIDVKLNFRFV